VCPEKLLCGSIATSRNYFAELVVKLRSSREHRMDCLWNISATVWMQGPSGAWNEDHGGRAWMQGEGEVEAEANHVDGASGEERVDERGAGSTASKDEH
jgi:hypothetical protein